MSRTWTAVAASAALAVLWLLTTGTRSDWTAAQVSHPTTTAATASVGIRHAYASTTCSGTKSVAVTCPSSLAYGTVPSSGSLSSTDTITNTGTTSVGASTLAVAGCDPALLANSKDATHPMLIRGSTTMQQADKWGTTSAIALGGGTNDYAADGTYSRSGTEITSPQASFGVWFKSASGYASGGVLMSLSASPYNVTGDGVTTSGATEIWMDNTGKIQASAKPASGVARVTVASTGAYNNGAWHLAVFTLAGTSQTSLTPTLWVDGTSATTPTKVNATVNPTAYWHAGWGDLGVSGASGAISTGRPTSASFAGSLSGAFFVNSVALSNAANTSPKISDLVASASASAYASALTNGTNTSANLKNLWMLGDTGAVGWTGTPTGYTTTDVCAGVNVVANPPSSGGSNTAAALSTLPAFDVADPAPGSSTTMTLGLSRSSSYNAFMAGLHLLVPVTYTYGAPTTSTWAQAFTFPAAASTTVIP